MTLSSLQLEAFQTLAGIGNFTRAAEHLGLTQSALSQRIANLEDTLHTSLFIRSRAQLQLTPAGEELLRYCQTVRSLEEEFLGELQGQNRSQLSGSFAVAGFSTVMRSLVLPAMAGLMREHPVHLQFFIREMHELPALLKNAQANFIILDHRLEQDRIESVFLGFEENIWVQSKRWKEANDWFLNHDPQDATTQKYFQRFGPKNKKLRRRYMDEFYTLLEAVRLGLGQAVLPKHMLEGERDFEFVNENHVLRNPVWLHYHAQAVYPRLQQKMLETLVAEIRPRLPQK